MNEQIYVIDPVVYVDTSTQPVGFWGAIGSAFSAVGRGATTVATKLGTVLRSPVMGKLIEGGVSIGGGLLMAKQAKKQSKAQLAAEQKAAQLAAKERADQEVAAAKAAAEAEAQSSKTRKMLLYGGAAAAGLLTVYLLTRKRR